MARMMTCDATPEYFKEREKIKLVVKIKPDRADKKKKKRSKRHRRMESYRQRCNERIRRERKEAARVKTAAKRGVILPPSPPLKDRPNAFVLNFFIRMSGGRDEPNRRSKTNYDGRLRANPLIGANPGSVIPALNNNCRLGFHKKYITIPPPPPAPPLRDELEDLKVCDAKDYEYALNHWEDDMLSGFDEHILLDLD